MPICDLCLDHVKRRSRGMLPLVNIPRSQLRQTSTQDLQEILRTATEGAMVCRDCQQFCRYGDTYQCKSNDYKNTPIYRRRVEEDQRVIEAVQRELYNRQAFYSNAFTYLAPSVPQQPPSW